MQRRNGIKVMVSQEEYELISKAAEQEMLKPGTHARRVLLQHAKKALAQSAEG